jgi:exopolysaccharide production protein ExoQ
MSPKLALFLCTVFVLFLLRLERKQSPKASCTLWITTIWMLCIASKPLGIWFRSGGENFESGSPLDQYFLISLLCLGLFILAARTFDWTRAIKENIWVMLLISYMLVSILWSDIPLITFKRWTRELIAVVMAFLVLTEPEPRQAMLSIFRRTIYILIPFSLLLIKYFPYYGVEYGISSGEQMWIGVTMQKNALGRLCMISALFMVWTLVRRRQGRDIPVRRYQTAAELSVLLLTLMLLKGPGSQYSATALISLAAGLVCLASLIWIRKYRKSLSINAVTVAAVLIIGFGILQPIQGGSALSGFTSSVERDETLTGRTEIWAGLVPVMLERPFLGYGYGAFWTETTRSVHRIGEAHSGYLDVLLDLGFVGMLLISLFLLASFRRAVRELRHDFDWGVLWLCLLLMALIHNITETSLSSFTTHLTAVLLFLAVASTPATSHVTRGVA